jgi:ketosteroid isomerase-like protein
VSRHQLLGDRVPASLAAYWDALDSGRFAAAADCFSTDAVYAVPRARDHETDARTVTVGAAPLRERFEQRGAQPWRHVPLLCVADEHSALIEGVLREPHEQPVATYVCSTTFGEEGRIDRYLAFSCGGARDPIPVDVDVSIEPADAEAVVDDYFAALDQGRFADAAALFSDDVLYSHPPYRHTGIDSPDRIEFRGRPALHEAFVARGATTFSHEVLVCFQRGPHCLFEGVVHDLPDGGTGSFISSLSLAGDGTIRRYVSFYCEPGVSAGARHRRR